MIKSAITVSLTPEAKGGPFVYWSGLSDACERAARLGFHGIEIFPRDVTAIETPALRECLDRHGLQVAAIGTGAGWVVQQLRLTSPDAEVRERAMAFIATVIDFAASFGAPAIIGSMQGRCDPAIPRDQALTWLAEGLEAMGQRAEDEGVPLIYEPLNRYETNLFNRVGETAQFLRSLRTRNIRILADLFHLNIEEVSIAEALRENGNLIGHVHFADSNRRAIGFGHIEIAPIARTLLDTGYDGYVSAEILPLPDTDTAAEQTIRAFDEYFPGSRLNAREPEEITPPC